MLEIKTDFLEKELNVIKYVDEHYGEDMAAVDTFEEVGKRVSTAALYMSVTGLIVGAIGYFTKRLVRKAEKELHANMDNDQELQKLFKELDDARNELYSE